ncbi:flagellar basal-body MS-ring/collar protein FliF [Paeniglutamicibacter cryotolerans]|uniref:Flagellar M-ring protein n=1 Tax=Paeniglutamicibacter cryotolerans TaxID=670079 RepID=A0A839QCP7_9MICC|nr:flagellar basal-body MS-ring/collar protein FliF [Paeniglutamicibacter cryotolerans]MBB2993898.1 flagellar M-ring protein FliF [Paeniglutamicibacter cryotolerans]
MAGMPAPLAKLGDSVKGFTLAQRTIAIIGVAVLVLGGIALATYLNKPNLSPLYSGLAPADASTIVEQLKADSIPYELTGGGGTIMVPEQNVYDARLKAAAAGLPSSSNAGYSLLDNMGVTSSEFQQGITYKRALEGELASTIQAMDGVRAASVKLAIPEQSVFVDSKTNPTASIFIETKPGASLSRDQVQALVHLTSAAVDGLKPEDVAVVDASGRLLSAVGVGATGGADTQALDYEARVGTSVQAMLDRIVGQGNATVAVAADMSMESAERTSEKFKNPKGKPALSESLKTEKLTGAGANGAGATGVLGPDNIAVPNGATKDSNFNSKDSQRNNAIDKVTENRVIPAGSLRRQTVSVAIDAPTAQGLNMADVTQLVSGAAGIDTARGDALNVSVVPFNMAAATAAKDALAAAAADEAAARTAQLQHQLIIAGVVALALVLAAAYALYARRNKQSREAIDLGEFREYPSVIESLGEIPGPATTTMAVIPAPELVPAFASDANEKRRELSMIAANDPRQMADYLRSVMDDGRNE